MVVCFITHSKITHIIKTRIPVQTVHSICCIGLWLGAALSKRIISKRAKEMLKKGEKTKRNNTIRFDSMRYDIRYMFDPIPIRLSAMLNLTQIRKLHFILLFSRTLSLFIFGLFHPFSFSFSNKVNFNS